MIPVLGLLRLELVGTDFLLSSADEKVRRALLDFEPEHFLYSPEGV
jgi:hypothetical protein